MKWTPSVISLIPAGVKSEHSKGDNSRRLEDAILGAMLRCCFIDQDKRQKQIQDAADERKNSSVQNRFMT